MKEYVWNTGGINFKDITNQCTFSWATEFDEITHGSLDNVHDGNPDTYCAGHTNLAGAGYAARIQVIVPNDPLCMCLWKIKAGAQIGSDDGVRKITCPHAPLGDAWSGYAATIGYLSAGHFNCFFGSGSGGTSIMKAGHIVLYLRAETAGDFAFEIYELKIIELRGVF